MRIAREISEGLQLSKHGEREVGTEHPLKIRESGNLLAEQILTQGFGVERGRSHNDIVPTSLLDMSELYHKSFEGLLRALVAGTG
jgi:hypothetical protein